MSPRVQYRSWPRLLIALLIVLVMALRAWQQREDFNPSPAAHNPHQANGSLQPGDYRVLRVIDGDTLLLEHARTRVRLQGIDTPETVKKDTAVEDWGQFVSLVGAPGFPNRFAKALWRRLELRCRRQREVPSGYSACKPDRRRNPSISK